MPTMSLRKRLLNFERALENGKIPRIVKPIRGIPYEVLVSKCAYYGVEQGVDIFIPMTDRPMERDFRRRWRQRRTYLQSNLAYASVWRDEIRAFFLSGYNASEQAEIRRIVKTAMSQFGTKGNT